MKINKIIKVPTGEIYVARGEKGLMEFLSVGNRDRSALQYAKDYERKIDEDPSFIEECLEKILKAEKIDTNLVDKVPELVTRAKEYLRLLLYT